MFKQTSLLGAASIALAIAFNIPFSVLGATFDYPDILRQPSGEVLNRFHAVGGSLVMTWFGFMLCALLMVPFSIWLASALPALSQRSLNQRIAIVAGSLAGILQAIGLSRWVFVVPLLATYHADPNASETMRAMTELVFEVLNLWGGVAIGEHLGQVFTCLFVISIALPQLWERHWLTKISGLAGFLAVAGIALGLGEGVAIALQKDGSAFSLATVLGYIAFSLWLVLTGTTLFQSGSRSADQPAAG